MESGLHYLVPEHYKGIKKDLSYGVGARDIEQAAMWLLEMKDHLLNINLWTLPGTNKLGFCLTNKNRKVVQRNARTHDLILLDPEHYKIGDIWNYASIDMIAYDLNPDTDYESIGIRICLPYEDEKGILYLTDNTTITLICERIGTHLSASFHLRNGMVANPVISNTWLCITDDEWVGLLRKFSGGSIDAYHQ